MATEAMAGDHWEVGEGVGVVTVLGRVTGGGFGERCGVVVADNFVFAIFAISAWTAWTTNFSSMISIG